MSALLDDIAAFAKLAMGSVHKVGAIAAKSGSKASGVVIDDAAVTPAYVHGLAAQRELPIIWRITKGSLRNKYVFLLPSIILLLQVGEGLVSALLLAGGAYLVYEGCAKLLGAGHDSTQARSEDEIVKKATRTDLVLSAEIMIISAKEVVDESIAMQVATLAAVAGAMTILVYGVVGLIVKADDAGVALVERGGLVYQWIGRRLVEGMFYALKALSAVGTLAMLWVGGHIVIEQLHFFGYDGPYTLVNDVARELEVSGSLSGLAAWAAETGMYLLAGVILGMAIRYPIALVKRSFEPGGKQH